ncbi:DUF4169 family protein [Lichenifustis flavocetrariae]|uniref:DUF4169 family protein n=1 Tax=Lichenifustis flavocetrariae TaxID=2949735 RepID=A0AA42CIL3_9HYPH|nr:DUF4169 family protein [Lichenifustis flavocetrariae]MCW6508509.1 DUF4169 family protein [Lichenifustis flavocetrariae]
MADVINLRQVRKNRLRTEKAAAADANRVAFGRTKAEKKATALQNSQTERLLEGHRRETPSGDA